MRRTGHWRVGEEGVNVEWRLPGGDDAIQEGVMEWLRWLGRRRADGARPGRIARARGGCGFFPKDYLIRV